MIEVDSAKTPAEKAFKKAMRTHGWQIYRDRESGRLVANLFLNEVADLSAKLGMNLEIVHRDGDLVKVAPIEFGTVSANSYRGNMQQKPTIPEVAPLVKAWYAKPGNEVGGLFHLILSEGNNQQHWANQALEEARASGDADAIELAEKLVAMSPTQRLKLSKMGRPPRIGEGGK